MSAKPPADLGTAPPGPSTAALFTRLVDLLSLPLLLLREDGVLVHANHAAHLLLHQERPLVLRDSDRVLAADPGGQARLAAALQAAALRGERTLLHWSVAGRPASGTVSSLGDDALGAVLLLALTSGAGTDAQAYADAHGLSRAETRVLQCLMRGDNSTTAATALGVTPATVRSQIVAMRRKTRHASVSALLLDIARLPPVAADEGN